MRLAAKEDVEAPVAFVYEVLTDFAALERMALRRGAEVERTDRLETPAPGMGWKVRFRFRGKDRRVTTKLAALEPGQHLGFTFVSPNVEGTTAIDLVEMGPRRTRLTMVTEVKPRTLGARLVLQGLRLARARVDRRFAEGIAQIAARIEDRWKREGAGRGPARR